ncbi:MAG: hypothetical protein SFX74_00970 [Fimbriimonadaceae bacterium]|nr:hypothetical protein [Fimbriimonadaceae bacterium]
MLAPILIPVPAMQATDAAGPQLSIYADNLIVRVATEKYQVPVTQAERPILSLAFRRDNAWAVWDDRGLTVRVGNQVASYGLAEIAVSPRIFSRDEILRTVAEKRNTRATALAGARRVGTKAYFVPRWLDAKGNPWLEALVEIDFRQAKPKPKLLARIPGVSLATKPIERQLEANADTLWLLIQQSAVTDAAKTGALRTPASLTRWSYPLKGGSPATTVLVRNATDTRLWGTTTDRWITGRREGRSYAAKLLADGSLSTFAESREPLRWLLRDDVPVAIVEGGASGLRVISPTTGARSASIPLSEIRAVGPYVVCYGPAQKPTRAVLVDPSTGARLADWRQDRLQ